MPRYRIETLEKHLKRVTYNEVEAASEIEARELVRVGSVAYDHVETEEGDNPNEEVIRFVSVEDLNPPPESPPPVDHDFRVIVTAPAGMPLAKIEYLLDTVLELGWESLHDRGADEGWRRELPWLFGPPEGPPTPGEQTHRLVNFSSSPVDPSI